MIELHPSLDQQTLQQYKTQLLIRQNNQKYIVTPKQSLK